MKHLEFSVKKTGILDRMGLLKLRRARITDIETHGDEFYVRFDVPADEPKDIMRRIKNGTAGEYLEKLEKAGV